MSRWIDADALIEFIEKRYEITWESDSYEGGIKDACIDILKAIDDAPSIDIVRCKECKHAWLTSSGLCKYCDLLVDGGELVEVYFDGERFCSDGEPKGDE